MQHKRLEGDQFGYQPLAYNLAKARQSLCWSPFIGAAQGLICMIEKHFRRHSSTSLQQERQIHATFFTDLTVGIANKCLEIRGQSFQHNKYLRIKL